MVDVRLVNDCHWIGWACSNWLPIYGVFIIQIDFTAAHNSARLSIAIKMWMFYFLFRGNNHMGRNADSSFTRPARRGMCAVCFCLFNRCDYFWHFFLCAKRVLLAFSLSSAGILGRNKSSVFLLLSQRMSHVCLLVSYIRCMHRICERYKYMKLSLCVSQGNRFPTSLEWLQKPTHT